MLDPDPPVESRTRSVAPLDPSLPPQQQASAAHRTARASRLLTWHHPTGQSPAKRGTDHAGGPRPAREYSTDWPCQVEIVIRDKEMLIRDKGMAIRDKGMAIRDKGMAIRDTLGDCSANVRRSQASGRRGVSSASAEISRTCHHDAVALWPLEPDFPLPPIGIVEWTVEDLGLGRLDSCQESVEIVRREPQQHAIAT